MIAARSVETDIGKQKLTKTKKDRNTNLRALTNMKKHKRQDQQIKQQVPCSMNGYINL